MYTPINQFKLSGEGKEVYERINKCLDGLKHPMFYRANVRNIKLPPKEFDLLLEGVAVTERERFKDVLPCFEIDIVRTKL